MTGGWIARAAGIVRPLGVTAVAGTPQDAAWVRGEAAATPRQLRDLVARRAAGLGTRDSRVAGTFLLEGWSWAVAAPALAALLHERRAPDTAPGTVRLRFGEDGTVPAIAFGGAIGLLPDDPAAGMPGTIVFDGLRELVTWVRVGLAGSHLHPLAAGLAPLADRPLGALRASVHDVLSGALVHLATAGPEPVDPRSVADLLFGTDPLARAPRLMDRPGGQGLERRRIGCCQMFRLGAERCAACPGAPGPDRD